MADQLELIEAQPNSLQLREFDRAPHITSEDQLIEADRQREQPAELLEIEEEYEAYLQR